MSRLLDAMILRYEHDVVLVRRRARAISELLHFERQDQTRIVTAVSEIARNAFDYAGGGRVEFSLENAPTPTFFIRIRDHGPGIANLEDVLTGRYLSKTGMGLGIRGARRLMEAFSVESAHGETCVTMGKPLAKNGRKISDEWREEISRALSKSPPDDPFADIQAQNQELLRTLGDLQLRERELKVEREMREQFVATLSHDLRSPLTAAKMNSDLILREKDLTPGIEKRASRIRKSIVRADQMIRDLLDANRIRAGEPLPLTLRECSLRETIEEQVRELRDVHGTSRLVVECPEEDQQVRWDVSALNRTLDNLLSNAFKYGSKTAPVVLGVSLDHPQVVLTVTNRGDPLSEKELENLFTPYRRSDSAISSGQAGWGLGLTLVKGTIEAHGGKVSVVSNAEIGTRFTLTIPISVPVNA